MGEEVKVSVRIRPQIPREIIDMCHVCTSISPGEPQVWLGKDKAFTFDNVYDMGACQEEIYETSVKTLIEGCLEGYNATVLAYGQTGSGKTYTMGTGFDINVKAEERGIIPRAVEHLFDGITEKQNKAKEMGEPPPDIKITAQFMELYNEEIKDLLDPARDSYEKEMKSSVKIHEDVKGGIYMVGITSRSVSSVDETLQCLKIGAISRTTASTNMNSQSSRSHAIFTLHIRQQRILMEYPNGNLNDDEISDSINEFETLTAKFHFVDLAGSERLKRTGATGERAKEGISINCGLLSLGNVISALGDKSKRSSHVPYRDSKLTRLLQDSLGGNSRTLMIACVSPSDRDFMETLNTLKYANRAKNIKNKVVINQDKSSQMISLLRKEIEQLQLELMEYKQGKRIIGKDGEKELNDMFHENVIWQSENNNLRTRIKALQETLEHQTSRITELLAEKASSSWVSTDGSKSDFTELVKGYLKEIEELRAKLLESEETCSQLRKQNQRYQTRLSHTPLSVSGYYDPNLETQSTFELLKEAKKDLANQKKISKKLSKSQVEIKGITEEIKQESEEKQDDEDTSEITEISDAEEEENGSSDTDSEDRSTEEHYSEDLAELTCEISIKQKLIEELELSQRRLQTMRQNYEEKLIQLQQKIRETEIERDRILCGLNKNKENHSEEKVRRIKEEFGKKIDSLNMELKKMQAAKREHAQLMKNQAQYERQIRYLKQEVAEMKRAKVQLLNKMKEESKRHKNEEQRRNREIAQLKKQSRVKENQIRSLEADKRVKETVLRRKHEEVVALRRLAKPMSDRVAGRIANCKNKFELKKRIFSPKVAKSRWQSLEKSINKLVLNKQSVNTIERDMERYLQERNKLTRFLEKLQFKRKCSIQDGESPASIQDIDDQIESIKANIDYFNENIFECQSSIVQIEESKDDMEYLDVNNLAASLRNYESKYLLEKLLNMVINQSFQVVQRETSIKELEAKLKQSVDNSAIQIQLFQHIVQETTVNGYDMTMSTSEIDITESQCSSRSSSPIDSSLSEAAPPPPPQDKYFKGKLRRKTATTAELMSGVNGVPTGSCPTIAEPPSKIPQPEVQHLKKDSLHLPISNLQEDKGIIRVTSAPSSLREMAVKSKGEKPEVSPRPTRKIYNKIISDASPILRRKHFRIKLPEASHQNSLEVGEVTPPHSPSLGRRNREDNVFSRLTSGTSVRSSKPHRGVIAPFLGKPSQKNSPVMCTHIAEGHSKAVLSVAATDDVLFSSSKDRTVKIWDIHTGQEIQSLGGHPNNVGSVRYCEYTRLAFSVSTAFIKVWDVRDNPAKCVQTLCSSGATNPGPLILNTPSRTLQLPPGETTVHDIALNYYGTTLFSACSNIVRIWDLRMFNCIGKLSGGHQAAVMCLAVDNFGLDNNVVVTGSKDHYIKVFEVMEGVGGIHSPKVNLEPPHYDGIQSLAINGSYLFSGSRDMCIKKWNLGNETLVQSLSQAHKDWVCALSFLSGSNILISGCRGGFLKMWAGDSCQLLAGIRAHGAPINCITTNNSSCIFTASNDCSIGIWKVRNTADLSPDCGDDSQASEL